MERILLAFCLLAPLVRTQEPGSVVLVVEEDLRPVVAAGLEAGARRAVQVLGWPEAALRLASPREVLGRDGVPGARALLVHVAPRRMAEMVRAAEDRAIPLIDLGHSGHRGEHAPLTMYGDLAAEAAAAAYWICGPFGHHGVGLLRGGDPADQALAKAFAEAMAREHPEKALGTARAAPKSPEAAAKLLQREMEEGASAFFVAAGPEEGRAVAEGAKLLPVVPVVVLASAALGYEQRDARKPDLPGPLPEGTVVMDLDLPEPEEVAPLAAAAEVFAMDGPGGAWGLAAFDAVVALERAVKLAGDAGWAGTRPILAGGALAGLRGAFHGTKPRADSRKLSHVPLFVHDSRFHAFPAHDAARPAPRPLRAPYDPREDLGPFSRWSTLRFAAAPDTTCVHFQWGDAKKRTIEKDCGTIKIHTGGRQPVIDHLVLEKLLARLMSITGEKFGLERDGRLVPGRSFKVSMTARKGKVRPRRTWPAYVAGDDPEAGGRAFGSYCEIYSTFIVRTIFTQYDLFEDPIGFGDLPVLTGIGLDESKPYVTGTREDTIYRLVDNFAGSMALTAAHEVGHLAGLGHDEEHPHSIMNVKEGAGISYHQGFFIDSHKKLLETTLGIVAPQR